MAAAETFDQIKKWCLGTRSVAEAEEGIRRDSALQQGLKTWSKRLGKLALVLAGLTIVTRAGFMLIPTVAAAAAYGAVKLASHLVDRDIRNKREAEEHMSAESAAQNAPKPSRQPTPTLTAKAAGAFNATVANDAAPPPSEAPKRTGLLKRFGLG